MEPMEQEKIESMETPISTGTPQDESTSPMFSLLAVLIMFVVLLGGGYYFMHKSGASFAINRSMSDVQSTPQQQSQPSGQQSAPIQSQ